LFGSVVKSSEKLGCYEVASAHIMPTVGGINTMFFTRTCLVVVQVFSLSVWEMGTLLTLGPTDSCEFFHDPFKGRRLVLFVLSNIALLWFPEVSSLAKDLS
jgi:hypothetical protein